MIEIYESMLKDSAPLQQWTIDYDAHSVTMEWGEPSDDGFLMRSTVSQYSDGPVFRDAVAWIKSNGWRAF